MTTTAIHLTRRALLLVPALVLLLALLAGNARAADLRPRATFPKPDVPTVDPDREDARELVVKFHEGTHVRLRDRRLVFDERALTDEDRELMSRNGLTEDVVAADVEHANELLIDRVDGTLGRLFARSEEQLAEERASLERSAGEELADLDLYYMLVLDRPEADLAAQKITALNRLRSVEISYPESLPSAPAFDIPPTTTINLVSGQGYLKRAPGGIDADWAGRLAGGGGAGIKVEDVEAGWDKDHEDLPGAYFAENGWNFSDGSHGAAVLGELAAAANAYGATGIVPDVTLGLSSPVWSTWYSPHNMAAAIDNAAANLGRGDVLVIEQQRPAAAPPGIFCQETDCSQFGMLPVEDEQAVFDAVRHATAKGIVVVEAAGNGEMNLDNAFYKGRFDRSVRDSGAIIVGAGTPVAHNAEVFTNFGSRIDLQGWGDSVATLGFGDDPCAPNSSCLLRANGNDARQWYTTSFGGTSSATPIVAGAAAAVNGSRLADGDPLYDSVAMRQWLRATGTPQPATSAAINPIGPLPNLRKALPGAAGFLDEITAAGVAKGWAFHSSQASTSVSVHFYVDGPAGGGGVFAGGATTSISRPDVNTLFGITGTHGFEFTIPPAFRDGASHTLFVYGIDPTPSARNRLLQQQLAFKLPPNQPPTIKIVTPVAGSAYSRGLVAAGANATDDGGTPTVKWYVDGVLKAQGIAVNLPTFDRAFGQHTIKAEASDGVFTVSDTVTIMLKNDAPQLAITSPTNGQYFTFLSPIPAATCLKGTSSDVNNDPASLSDVQVAWWVDGAYVASGHSAISPGLLPGTHTIRFAGTDDGGLTASATITVTVGTSPITAEGGLGGLTASGC